MQRFRIVIVYLLYVHISKASSCKYIHICIYDNYIIYLYNIFNYLYSPDRPDLLFHNSKLAEKNTCSILFVAELRTRDLVTWPSRPSPPSHRAACQLACNHNKHVAWPPSPSSTAGEVRQDLVLDN